MKVDDLDLQVNREYADKITLRVRGLNVEALAAGGGEFAMHLDFDIARELAGRLHKMIEGAAHPDKVSPNNNSNTERT